MTTQCTSCLIRTGCLLPSDLLSREGRVLFRVSHLLRPLFVCLFFRFPLDGSRMDEDQRHSQPPPPCLRRPVPRTSDRDHRGPKDVEGKRRDPNIEKDRHPLHFKPSRVVRPSLELGNLRLPSPSHPPPVPSRLVSFRRTPLWTYTPTRDPLFCPFVRKRKKTDIVSPQVCPRSVTSWSGHVDPLPTVQMRKENESATGQDEFMGATEDDRCLTSG